MPDSRPAEMVLQPQVFAERTATGMPVDMALDRVVEDAWERVEDGMDVADSMTAAEDDLLRFIDQVCADTARDMERADVILTPRSGWARVVHAPCCKRCAVLAGRVYQWSQGFERHPRCRCTHRKVLRGDEWPDDIPSAADLVARGDVRDLTRAEVQALDDGADLAQVVNARRRAASGMTTTEGMSRRGWARAVAREYARQSAGQEPRHRLTVTAIYRLSSDRDEAVRLLARNGYVTDRPLADVVDLAR